MVGRAAGLARRPIYEFFENLGCDWGLLKWQQSRENFPGGVRFCKVRSVWSVPVLCFIRVALKLPGLLLGREQRVAARPISNVDPINHPNVKMVQSGRRNWLQNGKAWTIKKYVLCSIHSFCCSCINEQECEGTCKIASPEYWETCCCPRLIENLAGRVKSASQIGASGQ